MSKPLAIVEIATDLRGEPRFQLNCAMNSFQREGINIPLDVAEELYLKLGRKLQEVREAHAALVTSLPEKIEQARQHAMARDDHFVSPTRVLCMHDHCGDQVLAADDKHPWDIAREQGWKLSWSGSDMMCPDCVGPKKDCPWKSEDNSKAY